MWADDSLSFYFKKEKEKKSRWFISIFPLLFCHSYRDNLGAYLDV